MSLAAACEPHFEAIRKLLEAKGELPRAKEALVALGRAVDAVSSVDSREAYLREALTPSEGTLLIYLEGNKNRPIRKRVLRVTRDAIVTEWHERNQPERYFSPSSGRSITTPRYGREPDVLDHAERAVLLATSARTPG